MSSLDQAFIRAYTKDRRTQNPTVPGSHIDSAPHGTSSAPRTAGHGDSNSNSGSETIHNSQAGKWFRVDPAGSSINRHGRMANEPTHEVPAHRHDNSPVAYPSEPKLSAIHPAYYPGSNLNANIHPQNAAVPYRNSTAPGAFLDNALPATQPTATQTNTSSRQTADPQQYLSSIGQRANAKPADEGRQTLANYLAQSQSNAAPPSPEAAAHVDVVDWTTSIDKASGIEVASSNNSAFAAWRYDTLANESTPSLETHLNKKTTSSSTHTLKTETPKNPFPAAKEKTSNVSAPSREVSDTQKIKEAIQDFNSVWEVDELFWPEVSDELFKQQERSFNKVAAYLSDACRGGLSILAVTSAVRGEGRTTVASCVARCAAKRGLKVVLVDGDLEHPSLADSLNLEIARGWSDALRENIPLEEVAVHSLEDQLTLIPLVTTEPSQDFSSTDSRIQSMLKRLTDSFDLVIVDVPQINSVGSRMIGTGTSPGIDAALLVTDCRIDDSQRIETALRRLKNLGIHSVGLVENFVRS